MQNLHSIGEKKSQEDGIEIKCPFCRTLIDGLLVVRLEKCESFLYYHPGRDKFIEDTEFGPDCKCITGYACPWCKSWLFGNQAADMNSVHAFFKEGKYEKNACYPFSSDGLCPTCEVRGYQESDVQKEAIDD